MPFTVPREQEGGPEAGKLSSLCVRQASSYRLGQIFYLADMGKSPEDLAKSVFVEKLTARGYEVLLLGEALDEVFVQNVAKWK